MRTRELSALGERSYDITALSVANWIRVDSGNQTTFRIYYKTAEGGQIPNGLISYTLTAKTSDGQYLQDFETGRFGTIYLDENGQPVDPSQLPSGLLAQFVADVRSLPEVAAFAKR